MIPFEWDDGFTLLLPRGVRVRPLLRTARLDLFRMTEEDRSRWVKQKMWHSPRYWGPPASSLEAAVRQQAARLIISSQAEENAMYKSVVDTAIMLFESPGITKLSCEDCRQFATDHKTGEVLHTPDGRPMRRHPKLPVPCEIETQGCAKGHWREPKEPSTLGLKVWAHYWQMRAIGYSPRCPIMARNWAILDWIVKYGRRAEYYPGGSRAAGGSAGDSAGRDAAGRGAGRPDQSGAESIGAVHGSSPARSQESTGAFHPAVEPAAEAGPDNSGTGCQAAGCGGQCRVGGTAVSAGGCHFTGGEAALAGERGSTSPAGAEGIPASRDL